MSRPRHVYQRCKRCGRTREETGHISGTGRCLDCAAELADANNTQLRDHAGPYFSRWRDACAAAFGVILAGDSAEPRRHSRYAASDGNDSPA